MSINKVTARFYVREVTRFAMSVSQSLSAGWAAPAPQVKVSLSPVNGSKGEENKAWASATPSGNIELTIGNPEAAAWFNDMLGKDVAITFEARED